MKEYYAEITELDSRILGETIHKCFYTVNERTPSIFVTVLYCYMTRVLLLEYVQHSLTFELVTLPVVLLSQDLKLILLAYLEAAE